MKSKKRIKNIASKIKFNKNFKFENVPVLFHKSLTNIKKTSLLSYKFFVNNKKKIFLSVGVVVLLFFVLDIFLNVFYDVRLSNYIKNYSDSENLEYRYTALILGAGINEDGTPSAMLKDRLDVGYGLLKLGKVSKLILSGDNREVNHNEPEVMKQYLVKKGISEYKLVLDYAGRRTYDSCYRAKAIFGQDKIYVVTQDFHITRAVFLCKSVGIDTIGITSDLQSYPYLWTNVLRDYLGMFSAFFDAKIWKPVPVLGNQIQI